MTVSYLKLKQNCNGFILKPSVKKSGASTCIAILISFKLTGIYILLGEFY